MKLALLTGVAATLSLVGAAGAQAETIYVEPSAPAYVYDAPAPVIEPGYTAVSPGYVVVTPGPGYVVPRDSYRVVPSDQGVVTTGYSATRTCMVDAFGFERCF